jgi:hypothetical protein
VTLAVHLVQDVAGLQCDRLAEVGDELGGLSLAAEGRTLLLTEAHLHGHVELHREVTETVI